MANTHFVLDIEVVEDFLLGSEKSNDAVRLFARIKSGAAYGWVTTESLPTLRARLQQGLASADVEPGAIQSQVDGLWTELMQHCRVVSAIGAEVRALPIAEIPDFDAALTMLAAERLGSPVWIVANRLDRAAASKAPWITPGQALEQLAAPQTGKIDFIDLTEQQRRLLPEIEQNINRVLVHGQYIMGPEISQLEKELAAFAGVRRVVTCSSGTDALLMALMAMDVGPGDAIFTTTFTFIATAEVIALLGATPVFVDIDPRTFNLDPAKLELAVAQTIQQGKLRPRGIIPVDLYGLPADYPAIEAMASRLGLFVLEDAAQGFGGSGWGRQAGAFGHAAGISFFPAKPLGGYGDGGAVATQDESLAERMKSIRVHGKGTDKYDNVRIGLNARLDTLQAAIILSKLRAFPDELARRQRIADRYTAALSGVVTTPLVPEGLTSAWAQYTVLSERRDAIMAALKKQGVPSVVYYPKPLHLQSAFAYLGYKAGDLPVAEQAAQNVFSLPMYPYLEVATQERIIAAVKQA